MVKERSQDLLELFAGAVNLSPTTLAVDHAEGSLTYEQLDRASTAFAVQLSKTGVKHNDLVPLITAHGTLNILAILGILKVGATYVPIDRGAWAADRIQYVLDKVGGQIVINATKEPFESTLYGIVHLREIPQTNDKRYPDVISDFKQQPDALACIIFTSGSTGQPKGVELTHWAIANYAQTSPFNMNVNLGDRVLHILSVGFDGECKLCFDCGSAICFA